MAFVPVGGVSDGGHVPNSGRFPRRNWVMVIVMRMLWNVVYVIPLLSMHQFVTNSSTISSSENEVASSYGFVAIYFVLPNEEHKEYSAWKFNMFTEYTGVFLSTVEVVVIS